MLLHSFTAQNRVLFVGGSGWGVVVFHPCELRQRDLGSGFLLHRFIVRRRRVILCKLRRRKRSARRLKTLPDSTAICVWPFGGALEPRGYSSFRGVRHPRRAEASESGAYWLRAF